MQELTPFLINFDEFEIVDDIIGVGLVLHQSLDSCQHDSSDPISFRLINFNKL